MTLPRRAASSLEYSSNSLRTDSGLDGVMEYPYATGLKKDTK